MLETTKFPYAHLLLWWQVLELLAGGEQHRHFGETKMNVNSSRSHALFRMVRPHHLRLDDCASTRRRAQTRLRLMTYLAPLDAEHSPKPVKNFASIDPFKQRFVYLTL